MDRLGVCAGVAEYAGGTLANVIDERQKLEDTVRVRVSTLRITCQTSLLPLEEICQDPIVTLPALSA